MNYENTVDSDRFKLLQKCTEMYSIKDKRYSGLLHIVDNKTNEVVKKTKTGKSAAKWVMSKVRESINLEDS